MWISVVVPISMNSYAPKTSGSNSKIIYWDHYKQFCRALSIEHLMQNRENPSPFVDPEASKDYEIRINDNPNDYLLYRVK